MMNPKLQENINQLLCDLTVAQRNMQILHWNLKCSTFVSMHPYFGDIYDTMSDNIDVCAEQIRFQDSYAKADLETCVQHSTIHGIGSQDSYGLMEAIDFAIDNILIVQKHTMSIITIADETEEWDVVQAFSTYAEKYAKTLYFLMNSREM